MISFPRAVVLASLGLLAGANVMAQAPATARVRGQVVEARDGTPVPLATVELRLTDLRGLGRRVVATTDTDGRFAFDDVAPEIYNVVASKITYVSTYFATTGFTLSEPGSPLTLKAGSVAEVRLQLVRGGVITGRVLDAFGAPATRWSVQIAPVGTRQSMDDDRFALLALRPVVTDGDGVYRAYGLAPGTYHVSVPSSEPPVAVGSADSRPQRHTRTFHPAAIDVTAARPVTVTEGAETTGVDISMQLLPTFEIAGRLEGVPSGRTMPVHLTGPDLRRHVAMTGTDGAFRFSEPVIPGRYRLTSHLEAQAAQNFLWAEAALEIDRDIRDAVLLLQPGMTATGRVERADGRAPGSVQIAFVPRAAPIGNGPRSGPVDATGAFQVTQLTAGVYDIRVGSGPSRLSVSIRGEHGPLADNALDIGPGQNVTGLVITIK